MVKTDKTGKKYDAGNAARQAIKDLRDFLYTAHTRGILTDREVTKCGEAMNLIADRLQTCDALEFKRSRK